MAFYTSFLTSSLLISVKPRDPFSGYSQFAQKVYDNKFTLITDDNPEKHPPITDKSDSSDPWEKMRIAYRWNPPVFVKKNDFDAIVKKISHNDSLVYYGSYYHLLHGAAKSCNVKVVLDTYTHPMWLSFAFPKGSKLQELVSSALNQYTTVDTYLHRLYQNYAQRRFCDYDYRPTETASEYSSFGLYHMQGAFVLFCFGIVVAVILIGLEILIRRTTVCRAKKHTDVSAYECNVNTAQ